MKKTRTLILLGALLTCSAALYAGFSLTVNDENHFIAAERLDTGSRDEGFEYSKLESLLRKSRDFANAVAAHCAEGEGGGGESPLVGGDVLDMSEIITQLNALVDGDDFCLESGKSINGASDKWSMVANSFDEVGTSEEEQTNEDVPVVNDHVDDQAPSVNVNVKGLVGHLSDDTMCDPTLGDIANVAGVMYHEAVHARNKHNGDDVNERTAYEQQAKFLCCAIDYINSLDIDSELKSDAIDQICGDLAISQKKYCDTYGGTNPLFDPQECGCPSESGTAWPPVEEEPNGESVPRERLDSTAFLGESASDGFANQSFQAQHSPNVDQLYIKRVTPVSTESWVYEMSALLGNNIEALKMTKGRTKELFFAARNLTLGTGLVYQCDIGWDGSAPTLSFSLLAESSEIGDVTGIQDISEASNSLVLFDYTNAKLWYINKTTGGLTLAASSISVPELLDFQGLTTGPMWNPEGNNLIGVSHWLSTSQNSTTLQLGREQFLQLSDVGADGSLETVQLIGLLDF